MSYVPLTSVWAHDGLAMVVFASLEDAGFRPVAECDLRGWMHYFRWPLGSQRPLTIWIPAAEYDEARAFLDAPVEPAASPHEPAPSFYAFVSERRRWFYAVWLVASLSGLVAV
jgi:hypothetical protein